MPLRSSAAAAAKRSRSFRLLVSTRSWRPVSGSTSQRTPAFGSASSAGSRTSTATTSWRAASSSSGRCQSRGPRKSETSTTNERSRASAPARTIASPNPPGASPRRTVVVMPRPDRRSRPISPMRPGLGGSARGWASPKVTTPSRFPRRVPRWPTAIATPSATSALRRSAVPNCIETDVSSTSQVTSTRSARSTRTCGSLVRALTFQSMRRTSSPGTYGRTSASSEPWPRSVER